MQETLTLTQRIGQTEAALRAVLDRLLAETGTTFTQWVSLTMIARGSEPVQPEVVIRKVANALKCDTPTVTKALDTLTAHNLVTLVRDQTAAITLTAQGGAQVQQLRQQIERMTERLYGDVSQDDKATIHRVLGLITARATSELEQHS